MSIIKIYLEYQQYTQIIFIQLVLLILQKILAVKHYYIRQMMDCDSLLAVQDEFLIFL